MDILPDYACGLGETLCYVDGLVVEEHLWGWSIKAAFESFLERLEFLEDFITLLYCLKLYVEFYDLLAKYLMGFKLFLYLFRLRFQIIYFIFNLCNIFALFGHF